MATRRVFVIWKYPLFLEAVRQLLTSPDIEWAGESSDPVTAREEIAKLSPDTVLIEEEENACAEIMPLLEAGASDLRVIRLSLMENQLSLYRREQHTVTQAEDLLKLIRGE